MRSRVQSPVVLRRLPRRAAICAGVAFGLAALTGCGSGGSSGSGGRPVVTATAPQVAEMVSALAGRGLEVESVVAPTADVHELELRPSQVRALRSADLVLRPGRGNDVWAREALDQIDARKVDVSQGLPGTQRHWWMDPQAAEQAAERVAQALDAIDPRGAATRAKALAAYVRTLRELDRQTARCLATVPADRRAIVTDHDAAGAYAARYGLRVVGTISAGVEPEAAPSAQRVAALERTMQAQHVRAVFPIAPHGSELSATVAQRGGAVLGEPLWADALPGAAHHHASDAEEQAPASEASSDSGAASADSHGPTGDASQATLAEAARRNGEAVAEALGADERACAPFLD